MRNLFVSLVLLLGSTVSQATLINYSGNFNGTFPIGSAVPAISGSWSVLFDDSALLGSGPETSTLVPTSFSLTPNPLGATLFDSSNVGVELSFLNGSLTRLAVGGLISGVAGLFSPTDDFGAAYQPSGVLSGVGYSVATEPATIHVATIFSGSFISTSVSVPEPSTLALLTLGLIGMASWWRRKLIR